MDIGDGSLQIGKLEMVPKTFIPQNSTVEIAMNKGRYAVVHAPPK